MGYAAVLFDLDNTLLDYDSTELAAMRHALEQHGFDPDDGSFWEPFWGHFTRSNTIYWLERFERKLHIMDVLELSYRDAFIAMGLPDSAGSNAHPRSVAAAYWSRFCSLFVPEDGAERAVARLHGRYKLGIVSNGVGEAQHRRLLAGRMRDRFEALIVSDESGVGKPDPRIFAAALEQLKVDAQEVLFIGDSLKDDYEGARAAGIDFCYYNRRRQPLPSHIAPTYRIEHLDELARLLPVVGGD